MKTLLIALTMLAGPVFANPFLFKHNLSNHYLKVEVLKARGLHFEIIKGKPKLDRIWTSPMVLKKAIILDKTSTSTKNSISNKDFEVTVNSKNLCIKVYDKNQKLNLMDVCPLNLDKYWKGLSIYAPMSKNYYGLGQYFTNPGTADGDLMGRTWDPLMNSHGNSLRAFSKGANSYAMFPVLYSMGVGNQNFLFFYDNIYKQMWSLNQTPLKVESFGDAIRFFIYSEKNIKKLRQNYMKLTGYAPVPTKDIFGLWISEFGYDSWSELQSEVDDLKKKGFPLDGAALDLQWFGGSFYQGNVDRSSSRFGTLNFDTQNFPNPKATIKDFKHRQGISLMTIEESYISKYLNEHQALATKGFMAKWCGTNTPTELRANPWWGIGGMIDWTNNAAGDYWHDLKRKKLTDLGISHHWTDLGEPEMYHENSCYFGFPELGKHHHGDIHNIYNFKWLESIARGYKRNSENVRPFMMTRSGTAGIQRFGAGFWSGDIGANMNAMTAHYNAQMHMSFSGVDYYGADIGGFHRTNYSLDGDANILFTQWFANATLFDFPIRSHTWNLSNTKETSPSKIGDTASNLANIQLRYKLFPYYYSLAHIAYQTGSAIINPMPMAFPKDMNLRQMGNQKMIGDYLMGAMVARYGEYQRNVYLPKAKWFNFHTAEYYQGEGADIYNISTYPNGVFQVPLFIKEGAIIPTMAVDEQTMNISGKRKDGSTNSDLGLIIVPSAVRTSFTLSEDDGVSMDYSKGNIAKTQITQVLNKNTLEVTLAKTLGYFKGQSLTRKVELTIYAKNIMSVTLAGKSLKFKKLKENKFSVQVSEVNFRKENKFILHLSAY